ncbi:MAG: leucyl/phenylalanyl-tRNA--protein transferase [Phycisphaerales bacterium]
MFPSDSRSFDPQRPDGALLLEAYSRGVFPMVDTRRNRIEWYCPEPRGVLPLDRFHVPHNLAKSLRRQRFEIRIDSAVGEVMAACAGHRGRGNPSWMNEALMAAYLDLAARGHVHSVEAWLDGRLVGGLYGVRLRGAFFGESMFVRPELGGTDASKVCLAHLVARLREGGFSLLDTQVVTDHMRQFGTVEIPAADYLERLAKALRHDARW